MEVRRFTRAEVAKHDTVHDCWMIVYGKVYDLTPFVDDHPGGDILMEAAGKDGSDMFEDVGHSGAAVTLLKDFLIGVLAEDKDEGKKDDEGKADDGKQDS